MLSIAAQPLLLGRNTTLEDPIPMRLSRNWDANQMVSCLHLFLTITTLCAILFARQQDYIGGGGSSIIWQ